MTPIIATYRLQFRNGMTFDSAAEYVPYLRRLGVSHLYASPIFTAVTGSTHGYDIVDYNEIDPAIGGSGGLERLHDALQRQDMGLILDIVPNHMAASLENCWWRSVVEHGAESPFARHFDIDWSDRLTLPILGRNYPDALAGGELALKADAKHGCLVLSYFDTHVPLLPSTYWLVAEHLDGDDAALRLASAAESRNAGERRNAILSFLASENASRLVKRLEDISKDTAFLDRLHNAQPWRLIFWKDARRRLSYRRFFEVTGLVGVRVEDDPVFDDVHRLVLSLIRSGKADGLRIDHVDGLAFPARYLRRLRQEVGPDIPIFVEKILGEGETLPQDWPVSGATGYEFIPAVADMLADEAGAHRLNQGHDRFIGRNVEVPDELRLAKSLILRRNFEGELRTLADLAGKVAAAQGAELKADEIETAIAELIIGFEVYRTYGESEALGSADSEVLDKAVESARNHTPARNLEFIAGLLRGSEGLHPSAPETTFRARFQQLTGPVMAKAVEDTLYYRHNPFIALNEVGCSPRALEASVDRFHETMQAWAKKPPGLLTTATHDTKRGEDARARLFTLAEDASVWNDAVLRWSRINSGDRHDMDSGELPGPETEWLVYQALAGAWPNTLDANDEAGIDRLARRFLPYVEKALREAKQHTDWLDVHEAYENAVLSFVRKLLNNRDFLADFHKTLWPFIEAGLINTASQTLAKLTAPGIPDIYQGTEELDFSLVDPDNRRPVEFGRLQAQLKRGAELPQEAGLGDAFKQWMIARCLECRAKNRDLFTEGSYAPIPVAGELAEHFVAYLRENGGSAALVLLQRLPLRRQRRSIPSRGTYLKLPERCHDVTFRSVLGGQTWMATADVPVDAVLGALPVELALVAL